MICPKDHKIKILMVLGNAGRGGAQAYVMNILRNIDLTRFEIDFLVNRRTKDGYEAEIEALGSRIYVTPAFKGINLFSYIAHINEILQQGKYDIVHGHASSSAALYLRAAKKHGCATIAHSHSAGYRGNAVEQIVKRFFTIGVKSQGDYWFGCSALAAKRLFGRNYAKNKKYHHIPNAITAQKYQYDEGVRQRIRSELGIGEGEILYGHVGTFSVPKNHSFLMEVFHKLQEKQGEKAHLVLLGEGALKETVQQDVVSRGMDKQVTFTGNVSNVGEYLMAMDVLIFPSLFEGLPLTLLEAQAAGLPCVISDTITDEVYLTDLIKVVSLAKSAEEWAQIAEGARANDRQAYNQQVAETRFNMSNSIHELMALYEGMAQDQ